MFSVCDCSVRPSRWRQARYSAEQALRDPWLLGGAVPWTNDYVTATVAEMDDTAVAQPASYTPEGWMVRAICDGHRTAAAPDRLRTQPFLLRAPTCRLICWAGHFAVQHAPGVSRAFH